MFDSRRSCLPSSLRTSNGAAFLPSCSATISSASSPPPPLSLSALPDVPLASTSVSPNLPSPFPSAFAAFTATSIASFLPFCPSPPLAAVSPFFLPPSSLPRAVSSSLASVLSSLPWWFPLPRHQLPFLRRYPLQNSCPAGTLSSTATLPSPTTPIPTFLFPPVSLTQASLPRTVSSLLVSASSPVSSPFWASSQGRLSE